MLIKSNLNDILFTFFSIDSSKVTDASEPLSAQSNVVNYERNPYQ